MLGNLHVRFGVGAGVKFPGLHHFILAREGQSYARLRFNVGPGASIEIPVGVDYTRPFGGCEQDVWEQEYLTKVLPQQSDLAMCPPFEPVLGSPFDDENLSGDWYESWLEYTEEEHSEKGFIS